MFCNGNCAFCSAPCKKTVKAEEENKDVIDVDYVVKDDTENKVVKTVKKLIGVTK